MITFIVLLVAGVFWLFGSVVIVSQQEVKIIERLGKFRKIARPGLNFKVPFIDAVVGEMDLRLRQLAVDVDTKTKDNVFVTVEMAIQYLVLESKVYDAFYKLDDQEDQIKAYVFDIVRAEVPKLALDEVFEQKDNIAQAVKTQLAETMDDFGYQIRAALVVDIDPDEKVKEAMNEINASQRLRVAAAEKAEGEKILMVKAAEAEAESKALQGKGIADQRKAIIDGLKESVESFKAGIPGSSAQDVMTLVLLTQYFDTIRDLGVNGKASTILLPHSPGGLQDIATQIRDQIITANQVK